MNFVYANNNQYERALKQDAKDREDLERLMDRRGEIGLLEMIYDLLGEKAEHVRHNWQDGISATVLDQYAEIVWEASTKMRPHGHK